MSNLPYFLSSPPTASPDLSLTNSPPVKFPFNLNTVNTPTNSATKITSSSKKAKGNVASSPLKAVKQKTERSHSNFLSSPPTASPDLSLTDSPPVKFPFNLNTVNTPTKSATKVTASSKKTKRNVASSPPLKAVKQKTERSHSNFLSSPPTASPDLSLTHSPPVKFPSNLNTVNTPNSATKVTSSSKKTKRNEVNDKISIADLEALASSRLKAVKQDSERWNSKFVKDVEAFDVHLHEELKIQTQLCQIAKDQDGKEYKKIINEKIGESQEAMKASYMKLIAEAQASSSRVFKTSIPELAQSLEKSVESLRSRYGNASNLG